MSFHSWFWEGYRLRDPLEATSLDILSDAPRDPSAFDTALSTLLGSAFVPARGIALDHFSRRFAAEPDAVPADLQERIGTVATELLDDVSQHGGADHASALRALAIVGQPAQAGRVSAALLRSDSDVVVEEGLGAAHRILAHPGSVDSVLLGAVEALALDSERAPTIRAQAVHTLRGFSRFETRLTALLDDEHVEVSAAAARGLLELGGDGHRESVAVAVARWGDRGGYDADRVREVLS